MDPSTHLRLWKFGGLSPLELAQRTWRGFRDGQLAARCAQFAYYSMLAMVPLLIVIVAAIGFMPIDGVLGSSLKLLQRALPHDAYQLIYDQILSIQRQSSTTYIASSVVIFLYGGSRLFLTVGEGLNVAFGHPPRMHRFRTYWLSLLMTFGITLLLMVALMLLVLGPMAIGWATALLRLDLLESPMLESFSFHVIRWVIVTAFLLVLTSAIYCFVPEDGLPWRWFTPGTVFAVAGWTLASQIFRLYVENFAVYNQMYGTLGGVIAMLLWLYLTGAILFMGGQINGIIYQAINHDDA